MDILLTIVIALVVSLISIAFLMPVAWKMAKFSAKVVESVATFIYKLRKAIEIVFSSFRK